jgi:hypothetical protein
MNIYNTVCARNDLKPFQTFILGVVRDSGGDDAGSKW